VFTLFVSLVSTDSVDIIESDPLDYLSTNAIPGSGMSRVDDNTLRITNPVSGTVYSGGLFGDVSAGSIITITGRVWNDNGEGVGGIAVDGLPNGTEPGLKDVLVSLSSGMVGYTDADGEYVLYAPPIRPITITETNPDNFV
jgi:hypothetical protein